MFEDPVMYKAWSLAFPGHNEYIRSGLCQRGTVFSSRDRIIYMWPQDTEQKINATRKV